MAWIIAYSGMFFCLFDDTVLRGLYMNPSDAVFIAIVVFLACLAQWHALPWPQFSASWPEGVYAKE